MHHMLEFEQTNAELFTYMYTRIYRTLTFGIAI